MFVAPCSLETLAPWGGGIESLMRERVRGSSGMSLRIVLSGLEGGGTSWGALTGFCELHLYLQPGGLPRPTGRGAFSCFSRRHWVVGGPANDRCQGTSRSVWGEDAFGQVIWELVGCLQGED